jgi:DNA-binding MarR family transcriptional regulator
MVTRPRADTERRRVRKERAGLIVALEGATREASHAGARLDSTIGSLLGVNDTDLRCLDLLNLRGAMSAGALAVDLGLTTGAVTTVIDRLERSGYACRIRSEQDRRTVLIELAPGAAPRIAGFFAAMQKELDRALTEYSDTEIHFLIGFFTRMKDAATLSAAKLGKLG